MRNKVLSVILSGLMVVLAQLVMVPPARAAQLSVQTMTNIIPTTCSTPPSVTTFQPIDPQATLYFVINNCNSGDRVTSNFYKPNSSLYFSYSWNLTSSGNFCFWSWILVANNPPASLPGNWTVQILVNGVLLSGLNFTIATAPITIAQAPDGPGTYSIRPGETQENTLWTNISSPIGDSTAPVEFPEPQVAAYIVQPLIVNQQYRIVIDAAPSSGSGFVVYNRVTGQDTGLLNVRHYEYTFTASHDAYGPVEVFFAVGGRTFITGFASTTYDITIQSLSGPPPMIGPVNELHPDGTLIKSPNNPTVYLLENGGKRGFPSPYHFDSWFAGRWSSIVLVSDQAIQRYPTGAVMPFKSGTLLKYLDRPNDQTVFIIENGVRRAFQSWPDFVGMGYSGANIKFAPGSILDSVPRGANISRRLL